MKISLQPVAASRPKTDWNGLGPTEAVERVGEIVTGSLGAGMIHKGVEKATGNSGVASTARSVASGLATGATMVAKDTFDTIKNNGTPSISQRTVGGVTDNRHPKTTIDKKS